MKRILVRAPNWIGDQVMAYPFFRYLRDQYPKAWIGVVCTEWVRDIQFRGFVDEVFVIPRSKGDSLFKAYRKIKILSAKIKQSGEWDLGIALPNSFGSALLLKLAGAKIRRGYDTDARGFLLSQKMKWNNSRDIHRTEAYGNLLEKKALPEFDLRDYWRASSESAFDPIFHWPDVVPLEPPAEDYAVIAPGAMADSRRWSASKFAALIPLIEDRHRLKSVIVGGPAEKEIAKKFATMGLPIFDYTAKGSVSSLWKIFRRARFTVCNESGLAHVASFCGSPIHIICGAADPKRTQPIGPGPVKVTFNPVPCWPCEKNVCRLEGPSRNQCLNGIMPEAVVREW